MNRVLITLIFLLITLKERWNRDGQLVFTTTTSAKGWDGRLKGLVQRTGVFVWIAEGIDDKGIIIMRKGTVTLIK